MRYADVRGLSRRAALPQGPTDRERILFPAALEILRRILTRRVRVRLVGVTLLAIGRRAPQRQGLLRFSAGGSAGVAAGGWNRIREEGPERDGFYAGIDRIRRRFGFGALVAGRSIEMLGKVPRGPRGFVLRTPALTR